MLFIQRHLRVFLPVDGYLSPFGIPSQYDLLFGYHYRRHMLGYPGVPNCVQNTHINTIMSCSQSVQYRTKVPMQAYPFGLHNWDLILWNQSIIYTIPLRCQNLTSSTFWQWLKRYRVTNRSQVRCVSQNVIHK